jgi:hypothetical protein
MLIIAERINIANMKINLHDNMKPSGIIEIIPQDTNNRNDTRQLKRKHKYILSLLKTNLSSVFILFLFICITIIISFNFIDSENVSSNDSDNSNKANLSGALSGIYKNTGDYVITDKFCGNWEYRLCGKYRRF